MNTSTGETFGYDVDDGMSGGNNEISLLLYCSLILIILCSVISMYTADRDNQTPIKESIIKSVKGDVSEIKEDRTVFNKRWDKNKPLSEILSPALLSALDFLTGNHDVDVDIIVASNDIKEAVKHLLDIKMIVSGYQNLRRYSSLYVGYTSQDPHILIVGREHNVQ